MFQLDDQKPRWSQSWFDSSSGRSATRGGESTGFGELWLHTVDPRLSVAIRARKEANLAQVKYQFMPPLSPEEYAELEASIREHGVIVPVLVDPETDAVIDGHLGGNPDKGRTGQHRHQQDKQRFHDSPPRVAERPELESNQLCDHRGF